MAKKIDYIKIDDMSKGINTFARDTMLKKDETADATNVIPTGKASLMKRPGVALMATASTASAIDGLGTFYATGVNQLLSMAGGHLYQIQSGTAVQVSAYPATAGTWTANKRTDFCQAGANVYISNGTDEMRYYDGTTVRNRTNGVVAKYMIYYKNCLYAIGNSTYPSRVYRSGLDTYIGDFTYSTANTLAASIYVSNLDGQENGTMFKHQDYLYVCKNRSTYRLSVAADATATMSYELVDPARGADSHFATDAVENDVYIFNEAGVHSIGYEPNYLDQIRTKILSLRVDPIIKAISKSLLDEVCAMYFNNFYHFSYPSGGATYNDKIVLYDRLRSGWWKYDLGARCFSEFKDANGYTKLYFGSPNSNKILYFDDALKADEGVAFPTEWKSPRYSVDNYSQSKFFLQALLYFGRKPGSFTISAYVDGTLQKVRNIIIGTTGSAGIGQGKIGVEMIGVGSGSLTITDTGGSDMVKIPLNKMGRNVQIVIQDNTSDKGWELNSIEIAYTPLNKIYQPNTV
jgi:hypothetical protein